MKGLRDWVTAWRMARFLVLSCKLDLHLRLEGMESCFCHRKKASLSDLPVWSPHQ